ncbi:MAG: peptide chain release factor N(5)-glutamine methyltransferase [Candidatus Amulumruptor caecigallinarius]|nr:peptide chain release factor N(5)-glutamine methyltransferase [Candidatus Amulumruptor caecigallinarius]
MIRIDFNRPGGWTAGDMERALREALSPRYGSGEAGAMTRLIFYHLKGWTNTAMIVNSDKMLSDYILHKLKDILEHLLKGEPLQYVLGEARFYGMDLLVNRSVLIPRHETEELVDMIVADNQRRDLRVLDVGTGSGAIAIALSRNLPFSEVTALDVSEKSLEVARENARRLHANIRFLHEDVFRYVPQKDAFDIVVSNPPYVTESEKAGMDSNVLDYEPEIALFVPDDNPLLYYSRIADVAADALTAGGRIYFEINPLFAAAVRELLERAGFSDVNLSKDISGRLRFAQAIKK